MAVTYDLRWDTDPEFSDPTVLQDVGNPSQVIGNLPPDTTIYAQVRACNANGCSDWSDVDSATTDPAPDPVTYIVRQSIAGHDDWTVIAAGITETEHLATDLEPDTAYDFQVRACTNAICSLWTPIITRWTDDE